MKPQTRLTATLVAIAIATPACSGEGSIARLFPWVTTEMAAPSLCMTLLDPGQIVQASRGALVSVNYGQGASVVRSSDVAALVRMLASPRAGTPTATVMRRDDHVVMTAARDVADADQGGLQCWFVRAGRDLRLAAIEILTPTGARR